jgi:L-lactate dehydrogenase complex protein LldG
VDQGDSGYISLLARTHIAIVAANSIVENPSDLFRGGRRARPQGLTRNFVFITGPSATADMGPLVRGVHGPHHLHIMILE